MRVGGFPICWPNLTPFSGLPSVLYLDQRARSSVLLKDPRGLWTFVELPCGYDVLLSLLFLGLADRSCMSQRSVYVLRYTVTFLLEHVNTLLVQTRRRWFLVRNIWYQTANFNLNTYLTGRREKEQTHKEAFPKLKIKVI